MRKYLLPAILISAASASWALTTPNMDPDVRLTPEAQIDTVNNQADTLQSDMESTLLGKDDIPLAVSGYMTFRFRNSDYSKVSPWTESDQARSFVDAFLNVSVVAMPNSYMTLWTNMCFPFDMSGIYANGLATQPTNAPTSDERVLYDHSTDYWTSTINEEMNFGTDIRAGVFAAYLTAGGVIWANASPLTMWERETAPRFLWQYETFEDEKTVSTYYKEKSFKPVKEGGRAFWTNRSFGGVFMNVYQLPFDMQAQFMVSQPTDMDAGTRDGLRMYGGQPSELEMSGDYDFRGQVYHGRIAKTKIGGSMTVGANYMGVIFDNAIIYEPEFYSQFVDNGQEPRLLNSHVASIDIKGNITPTFFLMADVGLSMTDSVIFNKVGSASKDPSGYEKGENRSSLATPQPGVYIKAQTKFLDGALPVVGEAVYFPKDWFSPYGLTDPSRFRSWRKDEMYLNAGSLRYGPNMVGVNFKVEPEFNRGHLSVQYGQHRQVEAGDDVLMFNYRLNGRTMWESTNSWTRYKALFRADSGNGGYGESAYKARLGVLTPESKAVKMYRQQGGLRGGTWEMWEGFVAYENVDQIKDSVVPSHVKWSSYFSVEGGYDIGNWFNTDRTIMMSGYAALSGISKTIAPIAYSEKQTDMLLWSFYGQFEPAVAVTPTFHLVGLLGLESFRAENAYTKTFVSVSAGKSEYAKLMDAVGYYEKRPINYLETAVGLGFDWNFADRAGVHVRYKYARHSDETLSENDWNGHFVSAETKVWF